MPRNAVVLEIVLSSPSDVSDDRKLVQQYAKEWNSQRSRETGVFFEILTWEDLVAPSFGERAQEVFNETIGDSYDGYLGIMWGRFGTPTGVADSGTEEEFNLILSRHKSGENVHIAMLFKTSPIPTDRIDGLQFEKVKKFKERCGTEGGFYQEYDDSERLRDVCYRIFEKMAKASASKTHEEISSTSSAELPVAADSETQVHDQSVGFFDLEDEIGRIGANYVELLENISSNQNEYTEFMKNEIEILTSLTQHGTTDISAVKPTVDRMTKRLAKSEDLLKDVLPKLKEQNRELVRFVHDFLDVSGDFAPAIRENFISQVSGTQMLMEQTAELLDGNTAALRGLPRLSRQFNRVREAVATNQDALREEFKRTALAIDKALRSYRSDAKESEDAGD